MNTRPFENIVEKGEKGENAGYQHFLIFPLCFLPHPPPPKKKKKIFFFLVTFILSAESFSNLDHSRILSFGKVLNLENNNISDSLN